MKTYIILIITLVNCLNNYANDNLPYVFSKVDYQQGLSNSAVISVFQDHSGLMWFGTYDGINCYDGKTMEVYRSNFTLNKTLNNNIIHSIRQADSNCLWISTHLGISRFALNTKQVIANYDFPDDYCLYSNAKGNTWVIGKDWIRYYNTSQHKFIEIAHLNYKINDLESRTYVSDNGDLWISPANAKGIYHYALNSFSSDTAQAKLTVAYVSFNTNPINYLFYQHGVLCFVDSKQDLYLYDTTRKSKIYIRNIGTLINKYGDIKGIIPFYDDIMIAFRTNGLFRLQASKKYKEDIINRNIRIFDIYKDINQDILWLGSDGKGAIAYYKKSAIATNIMLKELSPNLSRQVRSIMSDKFGNLWLGTKGDGIIRIADYRNGISADKATIYSGNSIQKASSYTKWDNEFQVYALKQSNYMNGFWIGAGESGLLYYSFTDQKLHQVKNKYSSATQIHGIYEANDSVLYLATSGQGLQQATLGKKQHEISIKRQKAFHFFYEQKEITMFSSMIAEGDSILWLGSRQKGIIRFNMHTKEYKVISLKEILHKSVDDVLCIHFSGKDKIYIGTTSGLIILSFQQKKINARYVGREQGLLNDMIHGILEDDKGLLWLGTNKGIIKYNPNNGFSHAYYYSGGVQIGEFSDDGYYKCPYTHILFFGGIDGLLYINKSIANNVEYYPSILLRRLNVDNKTTEINDYYSKDKSMLLFKGSPVSFSLNFIAPDYVTGKDIEYSYILEGYDKEWSPFSSLDEASYSSIPIGNYVFKVRYKKDVFNTEYKYFELPISILPLWYQTKLAQIVYLLLASSLICYIIFLMIRYFKREKLLRKLLETEQDNIRKSTTEKQNIEYLNCFTGIHYICDKLRTDEDMPSKERKKIADMIRETMIPPLFLSGNISKQDMTENTPLEFHIVENINLKKTSDDTLKLLEPKGMQLSLVKADIPEELNFPVYNNAFKCILYYCYYFLSCNSSQSIDIRFEEKDDLLKLNLNTPDQHRLNLLSGILTGEKKDATFLFPTNELFLMHTLLYFILSAFKQWECNISKVDCASGICITFPRIVQKPLHTNNKKTLILLENREEIAWIITEVLSDDFSIKKVQSAQQAFELIEKELPFLFIVDMYMYTDAEDVFMAYIKANRSIFSQICFIPMLNWQVSTSIQKNLIGLADATIIIPHDIIFLKEIINKAIYGKSVPKQIYIEGSHDITKNIICKTTEQAEFIKKVLEMIYENIDQEDMGPSFIASNSNMSTRQFYRKFKEISQMPPSDLIKNIRMEKAAHLLLDTELSIQEVIMEVGISSRSYFYKEFTQKYGMTPKEYRKWQGKKVES